MLEIVNPANGEKIQIADSDLVNHLNWQMAVNECKKLGNGWRLPTIDEIKLIPYNEMAKNDSLRVLHNSYWTSSETEINDFNVSPNALKFNFGRKMQFNASKDQLHLVRPIRTIQIVNQNKTSITNSTQNLKTVKAQSENETKSSMKNAIDSIPTTNFLEDLITGENLTETRLFILYSPVALLILFCGIFIKGFIPNFSGNGLIYLVLIILSIVMMLGGLILIVIQIIRLAKVIFELFGYKKNKRTAREEAMRQAKQEKEQAIQDEIFRKEQAKYEEEERIRKQRELEIWNSKSPNERAKIKFKEMEDAIHNLDGYFSDVIFREWESEFEKYVSKNEIISARDKIFQLRLLDSQQRQRQREINKEREHQRQIDRENDSRRREEAKDNKKWYCPKCGRVVPGRYSPTDRNCIGGKSHEWQLRG